ncbi:hypothetical protein GCM10028808_73330 [Spirosoma migulaei]
MVETGADTIVFTAPTITQRVNPIYPQNAAGVEIKQGTNSVYLTTSNVTSINGLTTTAIDTLQEIFDALLDPKVANIAVTTAATGSNWAAFASTVCSKLTIFNGTGTAISVRQGAAGTAVALPTGMFFTFEGITNASQIDVQRVDVSNTQVTVGARYQA